MNLILTRKMVKKILNKYQGEFDNLAQEERPMGLL